MTSPENPHLAVAPVRAGASLSEARMVGVLVHGRDQDELVMLDVARRLALPDVAYVLPVAAGRTWYPGRYFDPLIENQPQVDQALQALQAALALVRDAGMTDERIVLGGFSQGACLVAELVARRPRTFAGVAVLTGTLLGPPGERVIPAAVAGLPMLFTCSRYDDWIDFSDARTTAEAFTHAGANVTFEASEDRVHHVSDAAVDALRALFGAAG
jgi:phospholipase/carboxylesterase